MQLEVPGLLDQVVQLEPPVRLEPRLQSVPLEPMDKQVLTVQPAQQGLPVR